MILRTRLKDTGTHSSNLEKKSKLMYRNGEIVLFFSDLKNMTLTNSRMNAITSVVVFFVFDNGG